jgi:hypothetical protein
MMGKKIGKKIGKQLGLATIAACLMLPAAITSGRAEMQILDSNVAQFRVGSRIADADDLKLPTDGYVKVLLLPANETRIFKGPARRSAKDAPFGGTRGPAPKRPN